MAFKNLSALRYAKGNVVASVASADAVSVAFEDSKILWGSLVDRGNYGSQFLYQAQPNRTVRTLVTQTVAQVKASFSIT